MRKGGSKAAPSPADLKAGVLAEGGSRHTPFKPSRSAYNRLVVRNCSHLLTMSTAGERSVLLEKTHPQCARTFTLKSGRRRSREPTAGRAVAGNGLGIR